MSTTTDELALPRPDADGTDPADVPSDLIALTDRLELLLAAGHIALWSTGDFKISARTTSHGRWLLCDGRELEATEVVTELGLDVGDADDLETLLGTGGSSAYGAAATGKMKLPDPRGRAIIGVGTGDGLTARARGAKVGTETHTLTAAESGLPSHSHSVVDPGHTHTASQAAHTHTVNDPGHNHGITDPGHNHTASQNPHTHALGTLAIATSGASHKHPLVSGMVATFWAYENNFSGGGSKTGVSLISSTVTDEETGLSGFGDAHSHSITGLPANSTPAITVANGTTGISVLSGTTGITLANSTPAITVNSGTTGVSINAASSASASNAHNNMQPSLALGHVFIRV